MAPKEGPSRHLTVYGFNGLDDDYEEFGDDDAHVYCRHPAHYKAKDTVSGLLHSSFCVCLNIHGRNIRRSMQTEVVPTVCMNENHSQRFLVFADGSELTSEERHYYGKRIMRAVSGNAIEEQGHQQDSEDNGASGSS